MFGCVVVQVLFVKVISTVPDRSTGPDSVQEVPQFEFIDSPLNQHDLDSHVPVDGYGELIFEYFFSINIYLRVNNSFNEKGQGEKG